jgi:hypothetical protein
MTNIESKLEELRGQKEKILNNKNKITSLKKQISDLKINRNVAIYAHSLDEIKRGEELHCHLSLIKRLKTDSNVQEYIVLKKELDSLEKQKIDYYKEIQTKLKDTISKKDDPNIFVYYGKDIYDDTRTKNIVNDQISYEEQDNTIILPQKELKSNRKIRHFYNKTSFKYLEQVINTNDFSLNNKKLGKVKILSKESR